MTNNYCKGCGDNLNALGGDCSCVPEREDDSEKYEEAPGVLSTNLMNAIEEVKHQAGKVIDRWAFMVSDKSTEVGDELSFTDEQDARYARVAKRLMELDEKQKDLRVPEPGDEELKCRKGDIEKIYRVLKAFTEQSIVLRTDMHTYSKTREAERLAKNIWESGSKK